MILTNEIKKISKERIELLRRKYSNDVFSEQDNNRLVYLTKRLNILVPRVDKFDFDILESYMNELEFVVER